MNHTDYFGKLMLNMFHRKIRVNDGFGVSQVVTSKQNDKKGKENEKSQKIRRCGVANIVERR